MAKLLIFLALMVFPLAPLAGGVRWIPDTAAAQDDVPLGPSDDEVLGDTDTLSPEEIVEGEPCDTMVCEVLKGFPDLNAWLIAAFMFLSVMLRALAELLDFVALKTGNAQVRGWHAMVSKAAGFASKVLGWFGGGTPKAVLRRKVERAAAQAGVIIAKPK